MTLTLDTQVVSAALGSASQASTHAVAQHASTKPGALSGEELVLALLGGPGQTFEQWIASAKPGVPADAITIPASIVIDTAGRVGIVVGRELTVEPAGPIYMLTRTVAADWSTAYWPAVARTLFGYFTEMKPGQVSVDNYVMWLDHDVLLPDPTP